MNNQYTEAEAEALKLIPDIIYKAREGRRKAMKLKQELADLKKRLEAAEHVAGRTWVEWDKVHKKRMLEKSTEIRDLNRKWGERIQEHEELKLQMKELKHSMGSDSRREDCLVFRQYEDGAFKYPCSYRDGENEPFTEIAISQKLVDFIENAGAEGGEIDRLGLSRAEAYAADCEAEAAHEAAVMKHRPEEDALDYASRLLKLQEAEEVVAESPASPYGSDVTPEVWADFINNKVKPTEEVVPEDELEPKFCCKGKVAYAWCKSCVDNYRFPLVIQHVVTPLSEPVKMETPTQHVVGLYPNGANMSPNVPRGTIRTMSTFDTTQLKLYYCYKCGNIHNNPSGYCLESASMTIGSMSYLECRCEDCVFEQVAEGV